jgi:hypothetical protein
MGRMATAKYLDANGSLARRTIAQPDLFSQKNTKPAWLGRPLLRQGTKTLRWRLLPERTDVANLSGCHIAQRMVPGMSAEKLAAVGVDNPPRMARGHVHRKFPFVISVLRLFRLLLGSRPNKECPKQRSIMSFDARAPRILSVRDLSSSSAYVGLLTTNPSVIPPDNESTKRNPGAGYQPLDGHSQSARFPSRVRS